MPFTSSRTFDYDTSFSTYFGRLNAKLHGSCIAM